MKRRNAVIILMTLVLLTGCGSSDKEQVKKSASEKNKAESSKEKVPEEVFLGEIPGNIPVPGKVFFFDEKSHYDYASSEEGQETMFGNNTYGYFSISGSVVAEGDKDGFHAYGIDGSDVSLFYTYGEGMLNGKADVWHLVDDDSKTIDNVKLNSEIMRGTIILQTSQDGKTWINDAAILKNAFKKNPIQKEPFYTTSELQLVNGCYYRVLVAYKTGIKSGQKQIVFVKTDEYEYKKCLEVYEFYLYDANSGEKVNQANNKTIGELIKTGTDNGFAGSKKIDIKDPHYGWEMGNFFVSGFTRETKKDEVPVFLKNVGDQVTLWFKLKQNIDRLNENNDLTVVEDTGYDANFQTPKMKLGRGALFIRYTDEQGIRHEPEIYTNYLEANASLSADTIVKLFEEGDYEVSLNYEIKSVPRKLVGIEVIPEFNDYKIFFKFSVRNGNCMVFPFDVKTRGELTNRAVTENGFYLDLARSKYLNITVKRSIITEGADGLTEDIRFNRPAKDGDEYTDPGLYTITVRNEYTGEETTKEIFVGTDDLLDEYLKHGVLIDDLEQK